MAPALVFLNIVRSCVVNRCVQIQLALSDGGATVHDHTPFEVELHIEAGDKTHPEVVNVERKAPTNRWTATMRNGHISFEKLVFVKATKRHGGYFSISAKGHCPEFGQLHAISSPFQVVTTRRKGSLGFDECGPDELLMNLAGFRKAVTNRLATFDITTVRDLAKLDAETICKVQHKMPPRSPFTMPVLLNAVQKARQVVFGRTQVDVTDCSHEAVLSDDEKPTSLEQMLNCHPFQISPNNLSPSPKIPFGLESPPQQACEFLVEETQNCPSEDLLDLLWL